MQSIWSQPLTINNHSKEGIIFHNQHFADDNFERLIRETLDTSIVDGFTVPTICFPAIVVQKIWVNKFVHFSTTRM